MRKKNAVIEKMLMASDMTDVNIPRQAVVEVFGDRRVLIENHKGVCAYEETMVQVKATFGIICISGSNLQLARIKKDQLVISGEIDTVKLVRG